MKKNTEQKIDNNKFNTDILKIDCEVECQRIEQFIKKQVFESFKKKGIVIGISGGIDSAVVAALAVRAIGPDKVLGLVLPERESNPISREYAELLIEKLGIHNEVVEITSILESFDVYNKRESIVRKNFSLFDGMWKYRLILPNNLLQKNRLNIARLEVLEPEGKIHWKRPTIGDYLEMVAATNIKQRVRMIMLYYQAEKYNYLVAGTTNMPETLQGFFVKYGDGGVDIEPIAHLYKTQVFQMGRYLGIPKEIIERTPSPDIYSFVASDQEMYFCLPYDKVDLLLYAKQNDIPHSCIKNALSLEDEQIDRIFKNFDSKEKATEHFRLLPVHLN